MWKCVKDDGWRGKWEIELGEKEMDRIGVIFQNMNKLGDEKQMDFYWKNQSQRLEKADRVGINKSVLSND